MVGGGPTLGIGRAYLPWMREGVSTLDKGEGYLPWMGEGVPTLDGRGGTYLRCGRGTYLLQGEGYLPWMGGGVATLDVGGVPTLDGVKGVPTLNGGYLPLTGYAVGGMTLAVSHRRTFLFLYRSISIICLKRLRLY